MELLFSASSLLISPQASSTLVSYRADKPVLHVRPACSLTLAFTFEASPAHTPLPNGYTSLSPRRPRRPSNPILLHIQAPTPYNPILSASLARCSLGGADIQKHCCSYDRRCSLSIHLGHHAGTRSQWCSCHVFRYREPSRGT